MTSVPDRDNLISKEIDLAILAMKDLAMKDDQKFVLRTVIEKWRDNEKGTKFMWITLSDFKLTSEHIPDVVRIIGRTLTREWSQPKEVELIIRGEVKNCWEYTSNEDVHEPIRIAIVDE